VAGERDHLRVFGERYEDAEQHVPVAVAEGEQARCRHAKHEKGQPMDGGVLQDGPQAIVAAGSSS
jgi:hypothetical protein